MARIILQELIIVYLETYLEGFNDERKVDCQG
jgi:hypothetical protein